MLSIILHYRLQITHVVVYVLRVQTTTHYIILGWAAAVKNF